MRWLDNAPATQLEQIREELPKARDNIIIHAMLNCFYEKMSAARSRCLAYTTNEKDSDKARGEVLAYKYGTLVLDDLAKRVRRRGEGDTNAQTRS